MITLKNYKDHKPKRISFEGVNWQDDMELLDEIRTAGRDHIW